VLKNNKYRGDNSRKEEDKIKGILVILPKIEEKR
jgi:hypothetical protein